MFSSSDEVGSHRRTELLVRLRAGPSDMSLTLDDEGRGLEEKLVAKPAASSGSSGSRAVFWAAIMLCSGTCTTLFAKGDGSHVF